VGVGQKLRGEAMEVPGVRVVNEHTLEIIIDAPKAYFLAKLTHPIAFAVDRANVQAGEIISQPNGTGPFHLSEWRKGEYLILNRNPHYYREPASLERVQFILSGGRALTMYERGEIDIAPLGGGTIHRAQDPHNPLHAELVTGSELSVEYVGFNTTVPPFDDAMVRQAFNHAVDKDRLVEVVRKNLGQRADGILPPGLPGHDQHLAGLDYDPAEAKALIAASSYADLSQFTIVLSAPGSGITVDPLVEAVAAMWQDSLGVSVEIELWEWHTFLDRMREHRFQTFWASWLADYPDPENFLDLLFHSQSKENLTGYADSELDKLLERARVEQDQNARWELYQQAERFVVEEAPCLPLSFGRSYVVVKPYVRGYFSPPALVPLLRYVRLHRD
ncbi:ABC transporter substrate-binding protein, partial [Chloroflexota bacterium]